MKAIVTVRLKRNRSHDPRNKKTGVCPLYKKDHRIGISVQRICTDVTGEHHSYIEEGPSRSSIEEKAKEMFGHITRIEVIV